MRNEQPVKSNAELVRLEQTLGLPDLEQPSILAGLAAQAKDDPLGWIQVNGPKLLAHHILKLTILGESPDPRIKGTALKASADITLRALGLLATRGRANGIGCQEQIPEWGEIPTELRQKVEIVLREYEGEAEEIRRLE